jgi:hypothetical protein
MKTTTDSKAMVASEPHVVLIHVLVLYDLTTTLGTCELTRLFNLEPTQNMLKHFISTKNLGNLCIHLHPLFEGFRITIVTSVLLLLLNKVLTN